MTLVEDAKRIIEDFNHGRQLGVKSTARLLQLMLDLAHHVEHLQKAKEDAE